MILPQKKHIYFPEHLGGSAHVYYSRLLGYFYRRKLELLCDYLPQEKKGEILEIGFGSGIALKELALRFDSVYATDLHNHIAEVEKMLKAENVFNVRLFRHDIFKQPFHKDGFDCVFISSVLEHIPQDSLSKGIENIYNSLKDNGYLLLGFPLKTLMMRALFCFYELVYKKIAKNINDFSPDYDHPNGEKEIIHEIEKLFFIKDKRYFFNNFFRVYVVLKCKKIIKK